MAEPKLTECSDRDRPAHLYVIGDGAALKVGHSEKPFSRLSYMQASHSAPLSLLYVHPVFWPTRMFAEKYAHALLWTKRVRGEWFDVTIDQAIAAIRLASGGTDKGRLPPAPSSNDKHGSLRKIRRESSLAITATHWEAARRYRALLQRASVTDNRWVGDDPAMSRGHLDKIHREVRAQLGEVGVTLLARVVGMDQSVTSLPGSARQAGQMHDFVWRALDIFWAIDSADRADHTSNH